MLKSNLLVALLVTVLVLTLVQENEVEAAPEPCHGMYKKPKEEKSKKPDDDEEKDKEKSKKDKKKEKLKRLEKCDTNHKKVDPDSLKT
ncbi:unnamed protein product, partial [Iphiclides podalirius]